MRPKFGIHFEPLFGFDYKTIETITLNAEQLGYDSVWTCDHFFRDQDAINKNSLEAWTLLTALATKTSKMQLGVMVTSNSYRHPSMLAKIAATLDMISDGRLILGIGAGWKKVEYLAYGYRFPPLKERMDRLEEALQVIRALWTEDRANFRGEYYQLNNAVFAPKPIQKPHPPILIGGHGEKRTLHMVAKYGNMSNFSPWASEKLERLIAVLKQHCKDLNRDFDEITKTFLGYCLITNDKAEIREFNSKRAAEQGISVSKYLEKQSGLPGAWAGSPEKITAQYEHLLGLGFTHFPILFPYEREIEMSQKFAKDVIPSL
ncbi:MAG: LLM class F420-dependent oxidoreductase [Candidatus Thorarchaeota archaeon]|jgi:F420-dependent oxidoreductase-like protein